MSGALIIAALFALMPTLISLLSLGSVQAMTAILDERLFKVDRNVITLFEEIFGAQSKLNYLGEASLKVGEMVYSLAYALVLLLFILQIVSSLLNSMQGEEAENPINILLRAVTTLVFLVVIFGAPGYFAVSWFPQTGLLHAYSNLVSRLLTPVTADFKKWAESFKALNFSLILDPAEQVVLIILSFAIFKGVIEAGIVFVERWLTFALTVLFGPVFVSFYASKRTSEVFRNWLRQILAQTLSIFISYILLIFFYNSMADLSGASVIFSNLLFRYALCIALLALYKNSEKILNSVGLTSIATTSSLKEYGRGLQAFGGLWRNTGGAVMMGFGREAARGLGKDWGHSLHSNAMRYFGENSFASRVSAPFDSARLPDFLPQSNGTKVKEGMYTVFGTDSAISRLAKGRANTMQHHADSVNAQFRKGTGAPLNMCDVSKLNSLGELTDLRTSRMGRVGTGVRSFPSENGTLSAKPFYGSVFSATRAGRGKETVPSTYAVVPGQILPAGTEISLGSFSNGAGELTYRTNEKDPVAMSNGQGYMYEICPSPLSVMQFNADSSLSSSFENYGQYRTEYEQADKRMQAEFQADGFEYAWKYDASAHVQQQMFKKEEDTSPKQKTTYSRLSDAFNINKDK